MPTGAQGSTLGQTCSPITDVHTDFAECSMGESLAVTDHSLVCGQTGA